MRPGQQNKRSRGRSGRKNVNSLTRSFESNGPDVKVRGNAAHVAEKYVQLARDASAAGDLVMSENYLQHAEHYFRLISAAQAQNQARFEQSGPDRSSDDEEEEKDKDFPIRDARSDTSAQMNGTSRSENGEDDERSSPRREDDERSPPRREGGGRQRRPRRRREIGGQAPDPSLAGAPQPAVTL
ncbi:MAG: DUF4167 domain-containing protein, partial [Alphaproteobacteria bacterium]|nr:DUF4167 domain-containing protein [Alphaproteobacteria bacterium]